MKTRTLALILVLGLPTVAFADKDKSESSDKMEKTAALSDSDQKLLSHYHAVNQMEIDLSRIALTNATPQVKQFASMMVSDHGKADKALADFAKQHGLKQIAPDPAMTESDHKTMMEEADKLKALRGAELDREYLRIMVEGHDRELAKIDTAISDAQNKELAKMLTDMKPALQKHADEARKLQSNMPVSQTP